jgi:phage host-nuclease inhibitor protein Gam
MTRTKRTAAPFVCQSRDETVESIKRLGDAQRALARLQSLINDEIATITEREATRIQSLREQIEHLTNGIHGWCEANRAQLCVGGGKTANLVTGEISWRQRPPSVSVRAIDKVISTLKALGLDRFLREKTEINKEAVLAEANAVAGIAGITVVTGVEDFSVTPYEIEVAE